MTEKLCYCCKEKPRAAHMSYCRECQTLKQAVWRKKNKEKTLNSSPLCARCNLNPRVPSHSYCQGCRKESWNKWFEHNPDYSKSYRAKQPFNTDIDGWLKYKLNRIRNIAKEKGIDFNLTLYDLHKEYVEFCPILGCKLAYLHNVGNGNHGEVPSIDRIDPTKGYIAGNVWIISNRANTYKSNMTLEMIGNLYDKVAQRLNDQNSNLSETSNS